MASSDDGKVGYCVDGGHCTCEFGPALRAAVTTPETPAVSRKVFDKRGDYIRELREALAALWREVCEAGLGDAKDYRWPSVREMTLNALRVEPEEPTSSKAGGGP